MIIKLFEKSKPINLIIAISIITLGFTTHYFLGHFIWSFNKITGIITAVSSVLLIDFISKKNKLSNQSSFVVLFFSIFINLYWITTSEYSILYANFFILLALRKIISLKSNTNTIQKIFDAGFWIAIATLFSFWSILYFAILYVGIILYASGNYKHYLIPFISVFTVFVIVNSYSLFSNQTLYQYHNPIITFHFQSISSLKNNTILSFLATLIATLFLLITPKTKHLSKKNKSSYLLISITLLIAIIIFVFNPKIDSLLYTYFPVSVLLSAIFEQISKKQIQSLILYSLLIGVILLYFT